MDAYKLQIGQILRYKKPACHTRQVEEEHVNFHYVTHKENSNRLQLEKGINPAAAILSSDSGKVRPAILISTSPNKKGTSETPWQDFYNTDNGHIRYFGDNKDPNKDPAQAPGNKALLEAFRLAHSHDYEERKKTPPILFFKRATVNGKAKGYPMFMGLGVIDSIELVTQWDNTNGRSFTNYAFDFTVLCLANEHDVFNWIWVNTRREPNFSVKETNRLAPKSWNTWLEKGSNALKSVRRRVSKLHIHKRETQLPEAGSKLFDLLHEVYNFYGTKKHKFEALAEWATERVINKESGGVYHKGWITQGTGDGGKDFVGKVKLGNGFSKVELVVIGQAKCESMTTPTGGNHIARTVARLKRGWIGVYVTTSYFSDAVQQEIIEDNYPIILINGLRLAEELSQFLHDSEEFDSLNAFLVSMDEQYSNRLKQREPEEVLFD